MQNTTFVRALASSVTTLAFLTIANNLVLTGSAQAAAVRSGFNTSTLARNDDGSSGLVFYRFQH